MIAAVSGREGDTQAAGAVRDGGGTDGGYEDALRSLLRMRMQPNFPNPLSPEHQAVLSVPCGSCSNLPPPMAGWRSR